MGLGFQGSGTFNDIGEGGLIGLAASFVVALGLSGIGFCFFGGGLGGSELALEGGQEFFIGVELGFFVGL